MNSVKVDFSDARPAFDENHGLITINVEDCHYPPIRAERIKIYDDEKWCEGQIRSIYKNEGGDKVTDIFLNYLIGTMNETAT